MSMLKKPRIASNSTGDSFLRLPLDIVRAERG